MWQSHLKWGGGGKVSYVAEKVLYLHVCMRKKISADKVHEHSTFGSIQNSFKALKPSSKSSIYTVFERYIS